MQDCPEKKIKENDVIFSIERIVGSSLELSAKGFTRLRNMG